MAAEDSTLILSLKDGVSVGLAKTNASLRATAEAVSALDIRITALEGSMSKAASSTTKTTIAQKTATDAATRNAAAILKESQAYAQLVLEERRLAALPIPRVSAQNIKIDRIGRPYNATTGGTISATNAAAANEYAVALERVEVAQLQLVQTARTANLSAGFKNAETSATGLGAAFSSLGTSARHAINEASNATLALGAGLLALPLLTAYVSIEYQKDFASVNRALLATGKTSAALEDQLLQLTLITPLTFKGITQIAAAGGQMGIAAGDIRAFTKTVAELTVTTTISATAAESFIRKFQLIAGVGADAFANLSSALLNVGIHTGATEAVIASIATQIVGIGKVAGFTVPQIIGLSAAIGSISANGPSLARGTVTRFITDMQKAISQSGPALVEFAQVAGVSTDKVRDSFGTAKFAGVFQSFIDGLDKVQKTTGDANIVLNDLGITSVRDVPLLLNLASAHKLLALALKDADQGYNDSGILAQHYAIINATLSSKLTELQNHFGLLANQVGSAVIPVLTSLVNSIQDVLTGLANFDKDNPGILETAAVIATVLGSVLLLVGGIGKIAASAIAINQAYNSFVKLRAGIIAATAANTGLAGSFGVVDLLLGPIGIAIAAITVSLAALEIVSASTATKTTELESALSSAGTSWKKLTSLAGLDNGSIADSTTQVKNLNSSLITFASEQKQLFKFNDDSKGFVTVMQTVGKALADLSTNNLPAAETGFDQFAKHTDGSQLQLKRLLNVFPDYKKAIDTMIVANGGVVTTQSELALATGASTQTTVAYAAAIKQATDAAAKYQTSLKDALGNPTDKDLANQISAYQQSVSSLVSLSSVITTVQGNLTAAATASKTKYDGTSVSLAQLTKQYQANAAVGQTWASNLIIVAQKYGQDVANNFIAAGYSAVNNSILAQLANAAPKQGQAFKDAQDKALTLASESAADVLISAGSLVTANGGRIGAATAKAIGKQLLAGFSPEQIMNEFNLRFNTDPLVPKVDTGPAKSALDKFLASIPHTATIAIHSDFGGTTGSGASGGLYTSRGNFARGYAGGGYTGDGGKYQPAGLVHAGEFVFTKAATAAIGIGNLYSMMMAAGSRGYANGGPVASSAPIGGVVTVQLSPYDRALLAAAGNVSLTITSGQLAAATNSQGVVASNRRSG